MASFDGPDSICFEVVIIIGSEDLKWLRRQVIWYKRIQDVCGSRAVFVQSAFVKRLDSHNPNPH